MTWKRPSPAGAFRFGPATSFRTDPFVIYLLDTNAVSALMREEALMASWLSSRGVDDRLVICTVTRGEILFGLERLAQGRRRTELEGKARRLFDALPCGPIPPAAGDLYAKTKASQQRRGAPLDENDLWVAATALALGATLVTRDSDFQGRLGLVVVEP
jgi:predicted nucleic acid-binding protein